MLIGPAGFDALRVHLGRVERQAGKGSLSASLSGRSLTVEKTWPMIGGDAPESRTLVTGPIWGERIGEDNAGTYQRSVWQGQSAMAWLALTSAFELRCTVVPIALVIVLPGRS